MAVHLLNDALDVEVVAVEVHFLAVLCTTPTQTLVSVPLGLGRGREKGRLLNLICNELGAADVRGRSSVVMDMPSARAPGGSRVRNNRAALARGEKGLKRVLTWVMKRVIMLAVPLCVSSSFFSFAFWSLYRRVG